MLILLIVLLAPVALLLVAWAGSHMLRNPGPASTGNAFGGFDVFDPSRERGREDLESHKTQIVVTPAAGDGDDQAVHVDVTRNTVRIRPPRP